MNDFDVFDLILTAIEKYHRPFLRIDMPGGPGQNRIGNL
jgi:hypothetical protein